MTLPAGKHEGRTPLWGSHRLRAYVREVVGILCISAMVGALGVAAITLIKGLP